MSETDDTRERLARIEERVEARYAGMEAVVKAEMRGYVDGQLRSVILNVKSIGDDMDARIAEVERETGEALRLDSGKVHDRIDDLRLILCGRDGSNGLVSEVRHEAKIQRMYRIILLGLLGVLFAVVSPDLWHALRGMVP